MKGMETLKNELAQVLVSLQRRKKSFATMTNIPPGEFFVLDLIGRYEQSTPDGVALSVIRESSRISGPAVSQMLRTLEKKGFVTRLIAEQDRRKVLVSLTPGGKEVLTAFKTMFLSSVERVCEEFGPKDTETFIVLLRRFQDIFYSTPTCGHT